MFKITDKEFENLTVFVKVNYGIDLAARRTFVEMRLQKLMDTAGYSSFADYFNFVCSDTTGFIIADFISNLTINYTLFNRESFHFEFLTSDILPEICKMVIETRDLRMWSAGCATGEEPYTLAMTVMDYLGVNKNQWDMKILATDLSTVALRKAVLGEYQRESISSLNPRWISNYFEDKTGDPETVKIVKSVKDEVIFRKLNLIGDSFNFKKKFHFIFCRNVMIYFDEPTKNRLIKRFYDCLEDGGYLFIGMSESIDKKSTLLQYVKPSVYKKVKEGTKL